MTKQTLRFIFLLILQLFFFNQLNLWGYMNPHVYVVFILILPFSTPKWALLLWAFTMGFMMDIFTNTSGLHSISILFLTYFRPHILNLLDSKNNFSEQVEPNLFQMGLQRYLYYSFSLIFIHHFLFFSLESLRWNDFGAVLIRTLSSSLLTLIFVLIIQLIFVKKRDA